MLDERVVKLHWPIQFPSVGFYTNRKFIGRAEWDGNFIDIVQSTLHASFRQLIVACRKNISLSLLQFFPACLFCFIKGVSISGSVSSLLAEDLKGEKTWGFKVTFQLFDVGGRQCCCSWLKRRRWQKSTERKLYWKEAARAVQVLDDTTQNLEHETTAKSSKWRRHDGLRIRTLKTNVVACSSPRVR